jgi:hypothetical protein
MILLKILPPAEFFAVIPPSPFWSVKLETSTLLLYIEIASFPSPSITVLFLFSPINDIALFIAILSS